MKGHAALAVAMVLTIAAAALAEFVERDFDPDEPTGGPEGARYVLDESRVPVIEQMIDPP